MQINTTIERVEGTHPRTGLPVTSLHTVTTDVPAVDLLHDGEAPDEWHGYHRLQIAFARASTDAERASIQEQLDGYW